MALITNSPLIETQESAPIRPIHPNEVIEAGVYTPSLEPDETTDKLTQMRRIKSDLALTGTSAETERALLNAITEQNEQSMDALNKFVRDPESSPDAILNAAEGARMTATAPIDLATTFAKNNAMQDASETAEEALAQDQTVEFFRDIVASEKEMATVSQFTPYARDNISSRVGYTLDGASVALPFNFQSGLREIKESLGLESSIWDLVFFGTTLDDVKRHLEALSGPQQRKSMEEIHRILQNQGFTGTNEFIASALTEELLIDPHGSTSQEVINNIIGVFDLIGVGSFAKGMFGGFKRLVTPRSGKPLTQTETAAGVKEALGVQGMGTETYSAVLKRVDHANPITISVKTNPRTGKLDAAAVIADDTGQLGIEVGVSRIDAITEWVLPKAFITKSPITANPSGVSAEVARIRSQLSGAVEDIKTNVLINFTEEELKNSGVKALERMGKLFNSQTNVPASVVKFTDTGVEMEARFLANDVGGWTSVNKINNYIDATFGPEGGALKGLKIHKKNPKTGQWNDISKQMGLKQNQAEGEFSFSLDFKLDADPAIKEAFGEDAISAGLGRLTKYATNPLGMFDKNIVSGATIAKDKSALLQHRVLNILTDNFTQLRRGAPEDFPSVLNAIRTGGREEKWFDRTDLRLRFGVKSEKGAQAYEVFREVQDTLFQVSSQIAYKGLKREGYHSLYLDKQYSGFNVRAVEGAGDALIGKSVYVPSTQRVLKIDSKDTLDKMINNGAQFGTLKSPFRVGDNEYQFIAALPREGATIDMLAHYPVPYRQGHYLRSYEDGNYVIKVKNNPRRYVNGLKEAGGGEVLGVARTRGEADTIMEQLIKEENHEMISRGLDPATDGKTFESITGEAWHSGKPVAENEWDMINRSMLNLNRRRGEWLRGVEDLASIDDPLEATAKQIGAVMDKATKQDWIDAQQSSWVKTFSEALNKETPSGIGKWPQSTEDLVAKVHRAVSREPHLKDLGDRAVAHFEYVEMVRGIPPKFDQWWRSWNMKMAESTGGVGTKSFQWAAKQKPQEAAKTLAFKVLLGLNPFKHLQLQPSQILQMSFIEPAYIYNFGKNGLMRDFSEMASYSSSKAVGTDLGTRFPKGVELWEEFQHTGLSEAVAHHVFLNPGDFSKRLKPGILEPGIKASSMRAGSAAINAPQKIGFETGERANVMLHWLVARKRWMDRNPGKEWRGGLARDEIHAEQRAISLNPNPAGKMGYQDWGTSLGGISSLFLQFFSHGHKTLMSALPRKVGGSRAFTASEKVKIAGANVTLFGAAAVPFLVDSMDDIASQAEWDIDPVLWDTIKHGLVDIGLNRLLTTLSGEEQDIRFSTTFNPTTGIQAAWDNIYKTIMLDADYKPDMFAAAAVSSNIMKTGATISTIWSQPDAMTDEKLMQSINRVAEIAPGWSQYVKGKIALNTGVLVSKSGRQIAPATSLEAIAKMMGWTIGAEEDYYDNLEKLNKIIYEGSEKDIRQSAKDMLRDYMTIYKQSDQPPQEILLQLMTDATIVHKNMRERQIFMQEIVRFSEKNMLTGEDNLINLAVKASITGDKEELLNLIRNAEGLPEEARNAIEVMFEVKK